MSTDHTGAEQTEASFASLYARCLEEIQRLLDHTTVLTVETFRAVAQTVQEQLARSRGVNQDELQRVIDTLMQHWQEAFARKEQAREDVHTAETIQALTEQGISLLAHIAGAVKTLAGEVESHLQREREYHTGTVVGAGNFFCIQCDKEIRKVKTGPLPPCSRCHGTIFRHRR
jgi:iron-sulfur cluster repair protein YtfE (RIC family)